MGIGYQDKSKEKDVNEHFEDARRIIASWPVWKQEIGIQPLRNTDLNYKFKED